jgi:hypothetical protein
MRTVTDQADRVVIESTGLMRVDGVGLETRLRSLAGRYELLVDVPGLVMMRNDALPPEKSARVLMAGEIISRMTVMEIINIIAQANWRGELYVVGLDTLRVMSFDQGALKGSRSNSLGDRIGEVMLRSGAISQADLQSVLDDAQAEKRFGERCVERGLIDQAKLFELLQKQAEGVFYAAMLVSEGRYAFVLPSDIEVDMRSATFHSPITGLLMEGVQRIDEMALFRDKIPHSLLCPQPIAPAGDRKLDDSARKILELCDGARTIDDLGRISGLGEFLATKAVYHLLQAKLVALRSAPKLNTEQVTRLVSRFNEVMQDIFVAVATYGGLSQSRATIDAWIVGSGYAPYFGQGVDDFGMLDASHVNVAIASVESDRPLEDLHQALHELAAFALFSATTSLPRDQELSLARDVNARLKSIRIE